MGTGRAQIELTRFSPLLLSGKSRSPSPDSAMRVSEISGISDFWRESLGDPSVCVAFLDGPADTTHESLRRAQLKHLYVPPFSRSRVGGWSLRHGTHVVSIVLGQHDSPVHGLAPRCRGLVVPIFRDVAGRPESVSQLDLARAILYALERGADVINISGGERDNTGQASSFLADAIAECERQGTVVVAAAGNDGSESPYVPASCETVLAAGGMDARGRLMPFTNWGPLYSRHGLLAPAQDLVGARVGGGVATGTGTSYAAAVVSGVAALLISWQRAIGGGLAPAVLRRALLGEDSADPTAPFDEGSRQQPYRLSINAARARLSKGGQLMGHSIVGSGRTAVPADRIGHPQRTRPGVVSAGVAPDDFSDATVLVPEAGDLVSTDLSSSPPVSALPSLPPDSSEQAPDSSEEECAECENGASTTANSETQLVYAIGQPGYDLVSDTRRSSLSQHMGNDKHVEDSGDLLSFLDANPPQSESVEWTLNLGATPVYAIRPQGAFARDGYDRLRQSLRDYLDGKIERISIAGWITGQARLISGQVVPVVRPELRCCYTWTTQALVTSVAGPEPKESANQKDRDMHTKRVEGVRNFLERAYEDFRNLGLTPQERALNVAATNAMNVARVFESSLKEEMQLDTVDVTRSPICPPGSDCWDVALTFFNPARQLEQARRVYKFTVDVSDVCPVMVGSIRSWFVR